MSDVLALGQYEQGGYPGSPILSSAVFSTRDHRGADFVLPRHAVNSTVPLGGRIELMSFSCQANHEYSVKRCVRVLCIWPVNND